jgi:chromosome partitioning protein
MVERLVFFNNKGGVGKTTLVYHMAYMYAEMGKRVLVADFDPQANLTAMFLPQSRIEEIFFERSEPITVTHAMQPVIEGEGFKGVHTEQINENIQLIVGNLALSAYEDNISSAWTKCLDGDVYAFKVTSLFDKILTEATKNCYPNIILIDIGPNLGAINRAVLIASDNIILPVGSDLFSLQGIQNLGETLTKWSKQWKERQHKSNNDTVVLPTRQMKVVGYVVMQHHAKDSRPVKAYLKWSNRIPETYRKYVLKENNPSDQIAVEDDIYCLGMLRHYHSLMPLSMEARKPIFLLKPADGAIGAHYQAVQKIYEEFSIVAKYILHVCETKQRGKGIWNDDDDE